jgi:predicted ATPase/transcriptional regulator with XRE-family HTH domain
VELIQDVSFGDLLRHHRLAAGLTQEALAERAGLSVRAITDLERGVRRAPYRDTVQRLAAALVLDEAAADVLAMSARMPRTTAARHTAVVTPVRPVAVVLPIPSTPLIGREREIADTVARLSDGTRLLTLTGVGGVGKTRLALAVAGRAGEAFPNGVVFVDLAPLGSWTLVEPTIAAALELPETAGGVARDGDRQRSLTERLISWLRERRLLLVLDNFEHVLDAAPVIARLLTGAPSPTVLVTSRAALRLRGEQEVPVDPLPVPADRRDGPPPDVRVIAASPAVRLFVERALAVQPDFALTAENAETVAAICRRLDGLPLAIELAAARAKLLPPAVLLDRLRSRLGVLTGGARDVPARQRTLRDAIAWSYDLLTVEEQWLFRRLAPFAGGCSLAAAEAVGGGDDAPIAGVMDGLASLIDKSLLRRRLAGRASEEPRFAMLETVREFALAALDECGEAEGARRAHARFFLRLARDANVGLRGPDQELWRGRLLGDHDNLRAALGWACDTEDRALGLRLGVALGWFWFTSHLQEEGFAWFEWLLTLPGEAAPHLEGQARFCAAFLAWGTRRYGEAAALADASVPHCQAAGKPTSLGYALLIRSLARGGIGDGAEAEAAARESLAILEPLGDRWACAMALQNLGMALDDQGRSSEARVAHRAGIALRRQMGDLWGVATGLGWLVWSLENDGDYVAAQAGLEEMLAIRRVLGDTETEAYTLGMLAGNAVLQGDVERVARLYEQARGILQAAGIDAGAELVVSPGYIAHMKGDDQRAVELLGGEIQRFAAQRSLWGVRRCLIWLAAVAANGGHWLRVAHLLGAAAAPSFDIGSPIDHLVMHVREEYRRLVAAAQQVLGVDIFSAASEEGRALSFEDAVALALERTAGA